MMDWEFSLRASYLKANIAYYTGYNALSVAHPQTVTSLVNLTQIKEQGKKGALLYGYAGDESDISLWSKIKIKIGKTIYKQKKPTIKPDEMPDIDLIYKHYYAAIAKYNRDNEFIFINSH